MINWPREHEHHHPLTSEVKIASQSDQPLLPLQDSLKTAHTDHESTTIHSIVTTQLKVKKELSELIEEYKSEAEKMMLNHGYDPKKQANIRMRLSELQKQKQERQLRFERDLQRLKKKQEGLQERKSEGVSGEEKRKSIERRIREMKEREKKRREQEKEFNQFYRQFKASKPIYKLKEEQFNQKEHQITQGHKKKVLQNLKQRARPINQSQLTSFQQQYMQSKEQAQSQRQQQMRMQRQKEEWQAKQLEQLYKGTSHSRVAKEMQERRQKSQSAYHQAKRIREYSQYVKQQYAPQVNSLPTEEEQEEEGKGNKVMKEKFLRGHYMGKVAEYPRSSLSHQEHLQKGIGYLQYLKALPKKARKQQQSAPPLPPKRERVQVYKVRRDKDPLYERKRYRSIDMSMADTQSAERVVGFMRDKGQRLQREERLLKHERYHSRDDFQKRQREFDGSLVGHIEEKLRVLKSMYE